MSGATDVPREQPAIDHRCSAHAGAQREQKDVLQILRGAQPNLSQQRGVSIVQDRNRFRRSEKARPIQSRQTGQPFRQASDGAAIASGQSRRREADSREITLRRFLKLTDHRRILSAHSIGVEVKEHVS